MLANRHQLMLVSLATKSRELQFANCPSEFRFMKIVEILFGKSTRISFRLVEVPSITFWVLIDKSQEKFFL